MSKLQSFKSFISEAIPLSQYRNIFKQIGNDYKLRYKDWFDGKWRIYLPLDKSLTPTDIKNEQDLKPEPDIEAAIKTSGYKIISYKQGLATKDDKNLIKIGKILNKLNKPELLKKFNERLKGTAFKKESSDLIVISRHPYDIAGMSTDRGWSSCKDLVGGMNSHYIPAEIDAGMLVAYQIKNDDQNINKPSGRVLIVPYVNKDDESDVFLTVAPRIYGTVSQGFTETIEKWLNTKQKQPKGIHCLSTKVYSDRFDPVIIDIDNDPDLTLEDALKVIADVDEYELTSEHNLVINQDLYLENNNQFKNFVKLCQRFKINKVEKVNGIAVVKLNKINKNVDLQYLPKFVKTYYELNFQENPSFKSFKDLNLNIEANILSIKNSSLADLDGIIFKVKQLQIMSNKTLTDFSGLSQANVNSILTRNCSLTSFKGCPSNIENITIEHNHNSLSLKGLNTITNKLIELSIYLTPLKTLEGCPNNISIFHLDEITELKNLIGGPKVINERYEIINTTSLQSFNGFPAPSGLTNCKSITIDSHYKETLKKYYNDKGYDFNDIEYILVFNNMF